MYKFMILSIYKTAIFLIKCSTYLSKIQFLQRILSNMKSMNSMSNFHTIQSTYILYTNGQDLLGIQHKSVAVNILTES